MYRDADRQKVFTRRALMLAGGKMLLLSGLAGRMYELQVVESSRYATLAEENRINLRLLEPSRGRIFDRFGRPLAVNRRTYRILLVAEDAPDVRATLAALRTIVAIDGEVEARVLRDVQRRRKFVPVTVHDDLQWEQVARVEVNTPELPGISIDEGQRRSYPHGAELAHVIGYVAAVSENELTGDPLLDLPGFRIGKSGIEKVHDLSLRGAGGRSAVEVNAFGRVIRELSRKEGAAGADLRTTIDLDLQLAASRRLGSESAALVVIDVHSGEIRALVSNPGFDPNAFSRGLSREEWQALVDNPRAPLTNKAIAGQYAPGSTFKMAVALAALERGVINEASTEFCPGHLKIGNHAFHCWKRGGHGRMNLRSAIVESCDVYFYEVARKLGIDRLSAGAERLGLGQTLGIDLPGERAGLLPTRAWKQAALGKPWLAGETVIAGIGQGYVLSTPLQLAVMTARLVNGGHAVTPRLTVPAAGGAAAGQGAAPVGFAPQHLNAVREAMVAVVADRRGTARGAAIGDPALEMGGKTGTSQVRRITAAERATGVHKNEDLPWERRDHALFVGFAPAHAPRYAVAVIIEHGGGGAKAAAPVARDILREAQRLDAERAGSRPAADASPPLDGART